MLSPLELFEALFDDEDASFLPEDELSFLLEEDEESLLDELDDVSLEELASDDELALEPLVPLLDADA